MRRMFVFAAALSLPFPPAVHAATPLPDWLAGTWSRQMGAEWAEELWTAPRDGLMLGIARNGFGPDVNGWQYLRLESGRDGAPVLIVHRSGGEIVRYPVAVSGTSAIEFASIAATPQRIRFARQGQLLVIETSRMDGGEAERWNFRPVATGGE